MRIFGAIDRTSKGAFAELHPRGKRVVAAEFLWQVRKKRPDYVHIVPTDNGMLFTRKPTSFFPAGIALISSAANTAWSTA